MIIKHLEASCWFLILFFIEFCRLGGPTTTTGLWGVCGEDSQRHVWRRACSSVWGSRQAVWVQTDDGIHWRKPWLCLCHVYQQVKYSSSGLNCAIVYRGGCTTKNILYREAAQRAIQMLDNYKVRPGKFIGVCVSLDNCRLFIGSIPKEKTKDEVMAEMKKVVILVLILNLTTDPQASDRAKVMRQLFRSL